MKTQLQRILQLKKELNSAIAQLGDEWAANPDYRNSTNRQKLMLSLIEASGGQKATMQLGEAVYKIAEDCHIDI